MSKSKDRPNKQQVPNLQQVSNLAMEVMDVRFAREIDVNYVKLKKAIERLAPRDALQIMKMKDAWESFAFLVPFASYPTKKARFKIFPQSEEKLEYLKKYKEPGKQTMKDAIDTVLALLLRRLPEDYKDHKEEVVALLAPHLPSPGGERPVSLSMNSLGYALLQDLAALLQESQGAVLEAAAAMWLIHHNDLLAKRKEALEMLTEFLSQADELQDRLQGMTESPDEPIYNWFYRVREDLENLCSAVDDYLNKGTPQWREHGIEGDYE